MDAAHASAAAKKLLELAGAGTKLATRCGVHIQVVRNGIPFLPQRPECSPATELNNLKAQRGHSDRLEDPRLRLLVLVGLDLDVDMRDNRQHRMEARDPIDGSTVSFGSSSGFGLDGTTMERPHDATLAQ